MPAWTPDEAREKGRLGGIRSGEVRAERNKQKPDILARSRFEREADAMAQVIIKAAKGEGEFKTLGVKERAQFALKALEYGVGRPRPAMDVPEEAKTEQKGLAFAVAQEDATLDALAGVDSETHD